MMLCHQCVFARVRASHRDNKACVYTDCNYNLYVFRATHSRFITKPQPCLHDVHTTCTPCLHHVYNTLTPRLHHAYTMFTPPVVSTPCLHHVYAMFGPRLHHVYTMFTPPLEHVARNMLHRVCCHCVPRHVAVYSVVVVSPCFRFSMM